MASVVLVCAADHSLYAHPLCNTRRGDLLSAPDQAVRAGLELFVKPF